MTEIDNIIGKVISSLNIVYPHCINGDDLKQIAWLAVLKKKHLFDVQKGRYYTFIFTIVRAAIITALQNCRDYRHRWRNEKGPYHFKSFDKIDKNAFKENDRSIENFENQCVYDIIRVAEKRIKEVSQLHLQIFRMRFYQDMSLPKIANILNMDYERARAMYKYSYNLFRQECQSKKKWLGI